MGRVKYIEFDEGGHIKRKEFCKVFFCTSEEPTPVIEIHLPTDIKRNQRYKSILIPIAWLRRRLKEIGKRRGR